MDYMKQLISKSKNDFPTSAMLYLSQHCGLPHLASPAFGEGTMIPAVPESYIEKCKVDLSKIKTYTVESQISMMAKVTNLSLTVDLFNSCFLVVFVA